jgi:pyruvate dehydrogenase E2 component (dihydrolipoamide acetyltransferase)
MPQMGESVAEGTIVRWMKKVGDVIERDEPLFEISTDKVDAEIPSPAAGVLTEIKVKEGETVPVNSVVAVIGEAASAPLSQGGASAAKATAPSPVAVAPAAAPHAAAPRPTASPAPVDRPAPSPVQHTAAASSVPSLAKPWSAAEARELRLSPLVRKIAKEHHVDVRNIAGSGAAGRVTKADILSYIDAGAPAFAPAGASAGEPAQRSEPVQIEGVDRVPMTVMRRRIAEHMVMSRRTSAHVHSVFEVDFTKVDEIRKAKKADYEKAGSKITYMSFITRAVAEALKAVPVVNASIDGNDVLYKKDINIGVAVALDWGLIVPVIKNADKKNLLEISKAIVDVAARARDKKLSPDDVQGGTFTITNPGVFGALFGMPIINQPQVAILGVGAVEKRPVVVDDAVTIRLRAYMTLGYDHRIIDGAVADEFMSHLKKTIENFDPAQA